MKRIICLILITLVIMSLCIGCTNDTKSENLKEINKYFFELDTYNSLDYDYVNEYFKNTRDNWGGGCSAISAVIDGTRLVGRNMDLEISNKCAYFVKTNVKDMYQTIGLAYTIHNDSQNYDDVKNNGLDDGFKKILPFLCDDVLNSEGLHIEIDMRHNETDENDEDVFGVEHTNVDASTRIYVFNLGQYIALTCKNLSEVKDYIANDVDVYSQENYWNYSFIITDAEGKSALLEFGHGKYYWNEPDENGVVAQTNFYVNEECNKIEDIKTGLGRYDTLMNGITNVKTKGDLYNLMKKVQYSNYYLPYEECKNNYFDPRSEMIGEAVGASYDFVMDPENENEVSEILYEISSAYNSMSLQEKRDEEFFWNSIFTEIVNPKEKTIEVRLFENDSYLYRISFDGIEEINDIK